MTFFRIPPSKKIIPFNERFFESQASLLVFEKEITHYAIKPRDFDVILHSRI